MWSVLQLRVCVCMWVCMCECVCACVFVMIRWAWGKISYEMCAAVCVWWYFGMCMCWSACAANWNERDVWDICCTWTKRGEVFGTTQDRWGGEAVRTFTASRWTRKAPQKKKHKVVIIIEFMWKTSLTFHTVHIYMQLKALSRAAERTSLWGLNAEIKASVTLVCWILDIWRQDWTIQRYSANLILIQISNPISHFAAHLDQDSLAEDILYLNDFLPG